MQGITYTIAIAGVVSVLLIALSKAIYNAYSHPLSAYPGPWWMAVSDMVRLAHLASGRYVALNHRLHLLYGPVVRVGPKELSFIQPEAWKDIYGHSNNRAEFAKDPHFYGTTPNGVDHIGTADRQDHARMRSAFSHAFSERALRKQEPLIREHAQKMAQRMREHSERDQGGVVNILDMFNFAAFDITSALAFGEPLGLLDRDAYTPWVRALFDGVKFMTIRGAVLKVPVVGRLLQLLTERSLKRQFEAHFGYACDMVDRRLARAAQAQQGSKLTPVPDIWSFVLESRSTSGHGGSEQEDDKKARLTLAEMHSNASGFMIGGGETTSTTLSGVVYLLLRHPEAMRKLMDELRGAGVFDGGDDRMSWSTLARLKYLNACLTETLRLFPPAAVGLPRIVPPGGAKICGNVVPEGTIVYVSSYAAGHSPLNFHHAEEFRPERWLSCKNSSDMFAGDRKDSIHPFSYGPRNCIGKNLAWHQMRVLLCHTLANLETLELQSPEQDWMQDQKVYITFEKPPLLVRMKFSGTTTH